MTTQCFLKFQSFNIEGLSSKLKDDSFIDGLKRSDFITLVETWLSPKANINIDGYYCYNKARIKAKTARLYSGGISVLIKKSLRKGVKNVFHPRVVSLYSGSWKSLSSILKKIFIYVLFTFPL